MRRPDYAELEAKTKKEYAEYVLQMEYDVAMGFRDESILKTL